jgi:hypothetical protein
MLMRQRRFLPRLVLGFVLGSAQLLSAPALADPRFLILIRGVEEAEGVQSKIVPTLKELFQAELGHHPECTLTPPEGLPPPTQPEAMKAELKRRHLKAYEVTLRVLGVTSRLDPPKTGKQYKVLVRGIKLSVFGATVPEKLVALGGDGEAEAGSEVGAQANLERDGNTLLLDVSKIAIKQAVDMTFKKLNLAGKPAVLGKHPK